MQSRFHLEVTADPENLLTVHQFVKDSAATLGIKPAIVNDVRLAVEEIVTNIITHGYQNKGGKIEIEIKLYEDVLMIYLRDEAVPFDPTRFSGPDLSKPPAVRPVGGMGIYLTKQIMDQVTYRLTPNGENELTLIKRGVFNSSKEERC